MEIESALSALGVTTKNLKKFAVEKRSSQLEDLINETCSSFAKKLSKLWEIELPNVNSNDQSLIKDGAAFKSILSNLQNAFESAKTDKEKLEYLILLPTDWNKPKINEHFKCSNRVYDKLQEFRKSGGKCFRYFITPR